MVDLNSMTAEELRELRDSVSAELKARRKSELEAEREAKAKREAEFKGNVSEGDVIEFRFNKENTVADVIRVSEKSVTVEIEGKKKYIKYSNILNVVESASVEASEDEDVA